ncbi:MAG: DUF4124 domain-containing protein [Gammaproteobacteria bacterium]|nr:DUF4124 domain-containing protein [Gammaproteobacteria bacterium]
MKSTHYIFLMVLMASFSTQADVFKCKLTTGKIVYQSSPCAKTSKELGVVKVKKLSLEEEEAAKTRLKAWQEQQAAEEAAKAEADKARRAELMQQESLELQRRSVQAQEQAAVNAQQNQNVGGGFAGPRYGYGYGGRYWHPHDYPPNPAYPYPPYDPYYGSQYYQYPSAPPRRPGEYKGSPTHNTLPSPIKLPPAPRKPGYPIPIDQH